MSSRMKFTCGVPTEFCCGSHLSTDQGLGVIKLAHNSSEEAYNCMARYLVSQGYTRGKNREFYKEGCPTRVLTKKIRYGGKLVGGKRSAGLNKVDRFMPEKRMAGNRGLITG